MGDELDVDALLEEPYNKDREPNDRTSNGDSSGRKRSRSRDRDRRSERRDRKRSRSRDRRGGSRRGDSRERRRRSRSRDRSSRRSRDRSRDRKRRTRSRSRDRRRPAASPVRAEPRKSREKTPEIQLTPEERDARTVFVMQLSQRVRARDVEEFFSSVGKIKDVKLIVCNKTRRFKGIAYVEFREIESVALALGLNGQPILGVPVIVNPSQAEKNRVGNYSDAARHREKGPMRLYVGSLHFNITEDMLRGIFEPFGKIQSIQLLMDTETQRSKGYGFVTYFEAEDAKKALEQLNGFELAGRAMKVNHVTERHDQPTGGQGLDHDELDRSGIELGATGRLALMAKLAEGTGMKLPQAANEALQTVAAVQKTTPMQMGIPTQQQMFFSQQQAQQHLANMNPPIATECFMLSNMFDPTKEVNPDWHLEVRDDVIDECNKYGGIVHIWVDAQSPTGNVYCKCVNVATAVAAVNALHGRWFAGKVITAAYVPLVNYHNLFHDSVTSTAILQTRR